MAWYTDRRWMYEKIDNNGFLNSEYCDNVDLFLDFAFANDAVVDTRVNMHNETILEIKCPCYKCQNISYRDRATVQKHLYKEGFMLRYETWTEHGENSIRDVGQSSTTMEVDNDDGHNTITEAILGLRLTWATAEANHHRPNGTRPKGHGRMAPHTPATLVTTCSFAGATPYAGQVMRFLIRG
ncbi:hypothetical protein E3N88_25464 [Mikania micrantha]|uniref:Transposase-associated domain-containing protein n=1 Tax=Mikania micrantha TaxID=192012 RepID=A0A5N6N687_9ASTR|nr:hypothetical protein E3N88_25464 [Mikania micrantha]